MEDKVNELVEWVARRCFAFDYAKAKLFEEKKLKSWNRLPKLWKDTYRGHARKILSHPDLALIEWDAHASDCAVYNEPAYPKGECTCKNYIPKGWKQVIPLAEALKEADDGKQAKTKTT